MAPACVAKSKGLPTFMADAWVASLSTKAEWMLRSTKMREPAMQTCLDFRKMPCAET
jgi:hypothetical protein